MPPNSAPIPKNWPPTLPFLTAPSYSPTTTPSLLASLRSRPKDALSVPANAPKRPSPLVRITPITTPSHPANGQHGLFASRDLKPGTFILQYLGEIHAAVVRRGEHEEEKDPHANSDYDLSLDREMGIGIDADRKGNEARFINDYRGIAEKPNAEFRELWDEKSGERGMGVWVLPEGRSGKGKGIRKGEEILVSYGRGFWGARSREEGGE